MMIPYLEIWEFEAIRCGDDDNPFVRANLLAFYHLDKHRQGDTGMRTVEQSGPIGARGGIG